MKLTRCKKSLLLGLYVIVLYVCGECVSALFFLVQEKQVFSFTEHQAARQAIIRDVTAAAAVSLHGYAPFRTISNEVIHPYLGFVLEPQKDAKVSQYGFEGDSPIFQQPDRDTVVVGIFGGSFAAQIARQGTPEISAHLQTIPAFSQKRIIFESFALGGYKQPQQTLALLYFLILNAHFDIVINLDGFNEVALAPAENAGLVAPFYPRGWPVRVSDYLAPERLKLIAQLVSADDNIRLWAERCSARPWRYSITANLIWRYGHLRQYARRMQLSQRFEQQTSADAQTLPYVATGPAENRNGTEIFKLLADVWERSSLQMHTLCQAQGIAYFHFLQPNQYVPGSKIMGAQELRLAINDKQIYKPGVLQGYPLLRARGTELKRRGVNFNDLTMLFADNDALLYADDCCHVNTDGYKIVGTAIGSVMA